MTADDRALQFRQRISTVDDALARAVISIMDPLRQRHASNPHCPRDDLLRDCRRKWVQDIPTLGSLRGPSPIISHKRLRITETRCVCTTDQARWHLQEGAAPAIAIVTLDLEVRPALLRFDTKLLLLIPLTVVAEWFERHPDASDDDHLAYLARRLTAMEALHEAQQNAASFSTDGVLV